MSESLTRKGMLVGLLGVGAAKAAAKLDPDGEPVPDTAPLIAINAPGVTLSDFTIDGSQTKRDRVAINSDHSMMIRGIFK